MRKQHIPTVIKSPLLSSETLGGTGLKKPSWNISLSWRGFFLCSSSSHCVHRIFIPQWIHLTRPWASIHTIHTRLLRNSFSRTALMIWGRTLAQDWPTFDILSFHGVDGRDWVNKAVHSLKIWLKSRKTNKTWIKLNKHFFLKNNLMKWTNSFAYIYTIILVGWIIKKSINTFC